MIHNPCDAGSVKAVVVFIVALMAAPALALAEDAPQKTVIEFGEDTIEGDLSKPDGQYLETRARLKHQRLIKVRKEFRTELLMSIHRL